MNAHFLSLKASSGRNTLTLFAIIALGAYLRSWEIDHLFNPIHDYDEGVYSLSGLLLSKGYVPYRDFLLVHPPLHTLTLSFIYKIFGYDFLYGKYLSIGLSLLSIFAIYLAGKSLYHHRAGIVASALLAVSPEMVYFGRRSVHESMGIFLLCLAIYLCAKSLENKERRWLFTSGILMGLTIATKYIFIPAIAGMLLSIATLKNRNDLFHHLRPLGSSMFWIVYIAISAIPFSFLIIIRWGAGIKVAIPFFDPLFIWPENLLILIIVFIIPFFTAIAVARPSISLKRLLKDIWRLKDNPETWIFTSAILLGLFAATSFFIFKAPHEYFNQTFLIQQNRPKQEFPSLIAIMRVFGQSPFFLRMTFINVIMAIPILIIILNKRPFSKGDHVVWVSLLVSFILCQGFSPLPRYYSSIFPFLFLGMAGLISPEGEKSLTSLSVSLRLRVKGLMLLPIGSFFLFLSLTIVLLSNYTAHGLQHVSAEKTEEYVYRETLRYLRETGARKLYSVNPIFIALDPKLDTTLNFDTYAILWLKRTPPDAILRNMIEEGVDHIILDSWVNHWTYPYDQEAKDLVRSIKKHGKLVRVIAPDSLCRTEIYYLPPRIN